MVIFRKDPCGICTVILAYVALAFADYVVIRWLVLYDSSLNGSIWGCVHAVLFNVAIFLCFLSHLRAMITDPGIIPRPPEKERLSIRVQQDSERERRPRNSIDEPLTESGPAENLYDYSGVFLGSYPRSRASQAGADKKAVTICQRCDMYRPPRAHHCRICQGCIHKMDHHCPWINNCVGAYNQKYFLQFLFWVAVTSFYAATLTVYSWIADCIGCAEGTPAQPNLMFTIILMVECVLFGIFVCVMLFDQLSAIFKDETGIESLKHAGPFRPHSSPSDLMKEVCGDGFAGCWVCPCQSLSLPTHDIDIERDPRLASGSVVLDPSVSASI